ncbi:MAG: maltose ABC transporter substrate-binding protein [Chloroflexota bacterium]|jgi:maltose/maltodextrin transport system substrate-binding protein/arabinogalactan oligomer/maltooligosaccharide transport system substrate-binding protein
MKKHLTLLLVIALVVGAVPALTSAQEAPTLLLWVDETRSAVIEELGASFSEEYGVDLVVQQMGFGDIRDQLRIAGPAGEGPDIIIGAHDWLGELVTNGMLAAIDLGDAAEGFAPATIQALTWDGELYGVPYAIENVGFFYNTELVPTAPATFDEVRSVSEELMSSGKADYGFIRQDGDPYHFFPIQTAFGGYIFGLDDLGNYTAEDVGVDNEGSVAALQWLQGMIGDGLLPTGLDHPAALALMQSGEAAMYITGPWSIGGLVEAGTPFAIAPIPAGPEGDPGRPFLGVQAFMVSAFSKNPLLAQAFLTEWVASEEVQLALYEKGNRTPALLSAQEQVEDEYLAALTEASAVGQPMPAIPAMSAVWTAWDNAIRLASNDPTADAAELAKLAADAIREAAAAE